MTSQKERNFFLILIDGQLRNAMFVKLPGSWTALRAVQVVASTVNMQLDEDELPIEDSTEFSLLDWSTHALPPSVLVREIPKPGILFAIGNTPNLTRNDMESPSARLPDADNESASDESPMELDVSTTAWYYKRLIQRDEGTLGQRFRRHMSSGDTEFEPSPIVTYDAFISYASEDEDVALELSEALQQEGLRPFLASRSIQSGQLWQDEVRLALLESRTAILLLTPNSIRSYWIMCEAGACWALQKPMIPATQYVDIKSLPELISARQSRKVETIQNRRLLVEDVKRLCEWTTEAEEDGTDSAGA